MGKVERLKEQKRAKRQELQDAQRGKSSIEEQLRRLRSAKSKVESLQDEIRSDFGRLASEWTKNDRWKGETYRRYQSDTEGTIASHCRSYEQGVNSLLDALCDTITQLENREWEADGLIGSIHNFLNDIENEIEKALN